MANNLAVNLSFEQIQKGDLSAFEAVFRALYGPLVTYANKFVRQQEVAEEITQDAFIYLWEKRKDITIQTTIDRYLYTAVKNKCLNYIRLEMPRQQAQTQIEDVFIATGDQQDHPEVDAQIKLHVTRAIAELPDKCREIFVLSRYEGLTYDEIADEMDLSKKTVENQMSIALKKLRKYLRPILEKLKQQ